MDISLVTYIIIFLSHYTVAIVIDVDEKFIFYFFLLHLWATSIGMTPFVLRAGKSCSHWAILFLLGNLSVWSGPTNLRQLQSFDDHKPLIILQLQSFDSIVIMDG